MIIKKIFYFCTNNKNIIKRIDIDTFDKRVEKLKDLDKAEERDFNKFDKIIDNPLEKAKYLSNINLLNNEESILKIKDDKLKKIIQEKKFDIMDGKINLTNFDLNESNIYMKDLNKINLGETEILKKNEISIEDINPEEIPYDLKIKLDKDIKEISLIGGKIDDNNEDNIQYIEKNTLEEYSYKEYKNKDLNLIENFYTYFNFKDGIFKYIRFSPFYIFIYLYFITFYEYYKIKNRDYNLDYNMIELISKYKYK